MPFIPHTQKETEEMLAAIGVSEINQLFDEIPENIRVHDLPGIPETLSEMDVTRLMQSRAKQDEAGLCFIGAGAYEHHIPAAIFDLISRGEYLTAYTPYQAEASQGTLQLIYEYQTMMAQLTGMDVSNASLYDAASALAEAIFMAIRLNKKATAKRILLPASVHPHYRETVKALVQPQDILLTDIPFDPTTGRIQMEALKDLEGQDISALVISQPNFFGVLEDVDALTRWAKAHGILVIAVVNPTSLALLKPPGQWGELDTSASDLGADIVCGEGQPLGVPLASGGPYFGFLACKQAHVRQMPGRIVGRTTDVDGKPGFTLTLQAREQHIRRSKATSNICTNQGLLVTAATIYMSLLGAEGIRRVAASSHENTVTLRNLLAEIEGIDPAFSQPIFHECLLRLNRPVKEVLERLAEKGIQGGLDLTPYYPELANTLLICATETKTKEDLQVYAETMRAIFKSN
jgi:glycine dehydrogenase subunit 1